LLSMVSLLTQGICKFYYYYHIGWFSSILNYSIHDMIYRSLIADFMTYDGEYKPMNRIGMADISSTFLQMSFESTSVFMVEAALNKRTDPMMSPSSNIVLGHPIRHGTGAFECISKA